MAEWSAKVWNTLASQLSRLLNFLFFPLIWPVKRLEKWWTERKPKQDNLITLNIADNQTVTDPPKRKRIVKTIKVGFVIAVCAGAFGIITQQFFAWLHEPPIEKPLEMVYEPSSPSTQPKPSPVVTPLEAIEKQAKELGLGYAIAKIPSAYPNSLPAPTTTTAASMPGVSPSYSGPMPPPWTLPDVEEHGGARIQTVAEKVIVRKSESESVAVAGISQANPIVKRWGDLELKMFGCMHNTQTYVKCEGEAISLSTDAAKLAFKEGGVASYFGGNTRGRRESGESHIRLLSDVAFGPSNWEALLFPNATPVAFTVKFPENIYGRARSANIKLHIRWEKTYGDVFFENVPID